MAASYFILQYKQLLEDLKGLVSGELQFVHQQLLLDPS
jgi:hypothetical protein